MRAALGGSVGVLQVQAPTPASVIAVDCQTLGVETPSCHQLLDQQRITLRSLSVGLPLPCVISSKCLSFLAHPADKEVGALFKYHGVGSCPMTSINGKAIY